MDKVVVFCIIFCSLVGCKTDSFVKRKYTGGVFIPKYQGPSHPTKHLNQLANENQLTLIGQADETGGPVKIELEKLSTNKSTEQQKLASSELTKQVHQPKSVAKDVVSSKNLHSDSILPKSRLRKPLFNKNFFGFSKLRKDHLHHSRSSKNTLNTTSSAVPKSQFLGWIKTAFTLLGGYSGFLLSIYVLLLELYWIAGILFLLSILGVIGIWLKLGRVGEFITNLVFLLGVATLIASLFYSALIIAIL